MSAEFVSGVLAAWTVAQFGLALFFGFAYRLGRREQEYLLFSLVCGAFSMVTAGMASKYAAPFVESVFLSNAIIYSGLVAAAPLNLHFAYRLSFPERSAKCLLPYYGLSLLFWAGMLLGWFWIPGSFRERSGDLLGIEARLVFGTPTPFAFAFFGSGVIATVLCIALFVRAYRGGRREALITLLGVAVMLVGMLHDLAVTLSFAEHAALVLPHAFMVYAAGAAGTLLLRYRRTAGALEQTASSLKQRTEELHHSYAELRQVQNELVAKKQLAAVGELAAAIAHEVRNPLAIIVNALAGLRRSAVSEGERSMLLGIVEEEAARLNRLVTDLLRFARPVNVRRAPVSLVELANRCRMSAADSCEVRVAIDDDPRIQIVDVDPNLFRIVFDNLVANACQSMDPGGIVQVRISTGDLDGAPAVRIDIEDGGYGMEPQVLERALDPFFTTRPSGTGLGLPIVHRIVEAHGGVMALDSSEDEGTTVTILVPLGESAATSRAPAEEQTA
ncbi:MAG TPA: ATP-binding protein [Polyangiaceae bacterium]|nr:ATP-binding protein [Polyangiaceae bacterium]